MSKFTFSILLISSFSAMLGLSAISPFLPEFAASHGANGFWLGMIFAGFAISRGLVMPIIGRISDIKGRKLFIATGLLLYTISSLLYTVADSAHIMTLVRALQGLAAGMVTPIVMAYVGEYAEAGRRGVSTGAVNMMLYLGLAFGPLVAGFVHKGFGFDVVFYLMAGIGFFNFFLVLFFLPESAKKGARPEGEPVTVKSLLRRNFIKAVLIITVVVTLMMAAFLSFLPSLAARINVDTHHIGIIIAVGVFVGGIFQIPFARLADRLDRVGKLFQVGAGTSIGMLALLVMPLCPDFAALVAAGSLMGFGASVSTSALLNISMGIGQQAGMGLWMGIFNTAQSIGIVIAPLLSGIIMDHLGVEYVFYTIFLCALLGGLTYFHYVRRRLAGHREG